MTINRPLKFFYYAVAVGRNPGIYHSQKCLMKEVEGFEGAVYAKLPTSKDAIAFINQHHKKPNRYYTNSKFLTNPYRKLIDGKNAPEMKEQVKKSSPAEKAEKTPTPQKSSAPTAAQKFAKVFEDEKKAQSSAPVTQTASSTAKPRFIWK